MTYNFKDFFAGVIYVFVIFLPGGIALASLVYGIPNVKEAIETAIKHSEAKWLLVIAGSYILGHFISGAGGAFEDWYYPKKKGGAKAKEEITPDLRAAGHSIVQSILPSSLIEEKNVRRWAQALLRQSQSAAYPAIEQKDADRRFFRNFLIAVLVPLGILVARSYWSVSFRVPAAVTMLILLLSYLRYDHQDRKFTQMIFEALVAAYPERITGSRTAHQEFERRFLVTDGARLKFENGITIRQGYLSTDPERVVRVRLEDHDGWLTIKGRSSGESQPEYEYRIPEADARALIDTLCGGRIVEKDRYEVKAMGSVWEVDVFKGRHAGLVIAELEAGSRKALEKALESKPGWLGEDITTNYEYRNSRLAEPAASE